MDRRGFLILGGAALAVAVAGCSTTSGPRVAPQRSASGKISKVKAKERIAAWAIGRGYTIQQDSDFVMTFYRRATDFASAMLLSSNYDSTVHDRAVFQFVGDNPVTVTWKFYKVTNPGSAFERLTDLTDSPNNDAPQLELEALLAQP